MPNRPSPRPTDGTDALVETVRDGISVPTSHLASGFAITRHDEAHAALSSLSDIIEGLKGLNKQLTTDYNALLIQSTHELSAAEARNAELERVVEAARLVAWNASQPELDGLYEALNALSQLTEDAAFVRRTRQAVQEQREEGDAE